ncbi:hypothetical protein AMK59_5066, partial [Oryctes borbonicus]
MILSVLVLISTYPILILSNSVVQDIYWRDYVPGTIPYDAFLVEKNRYVGQALHQGNNPGTLYPSTNVIAIDWNGRVCYRENIKILCTGDVSRLYWESVDFTKSHTTQMKNAVRGGWQPGLELFIGYALESGETKVGKVVSMDVASTLGLYIWDANGKPKKI